jgi:hypothetical protein
MPIYLIVIFSVITTLSIALNIHLLTRIKKKPLQESLELKQFLADLLSGPAIVAISRIDPDSIVLRSPRAK